MRKRQVRRKKRRIRIRRWTINHSPMCSSKSVVSLVHKARNKRAMNSMKGNKLIHVYNKIWTMGMDGQMKMATVMEEVVMMVGTIKTRMVGTTKTIRVGTTKAMMTWNKSWQMPKYPSLNKNLRVS
jgi:hypothetical protein